jgi:hypothetical protein
MEKVYKILDFEYREEELNGKNEIETVLKIIPEIQLIGMNLLKYKQLWNRFTFSSDYENFADSIFKEMVLVPNELKEGKIKIKDFDALDELISLCQDVMEKKDKAQPNRKKSTLIEE